MQSARSGFTPKRRHIDGKREGEMDYGASEIDKAEAQSVPQSESGQRNMQRPCFGIEFSPRKDVLKPNQISSINTKSYITYCLLITDLLSACLASPTRLTSHKPLSSSTQISLLQPFIANFRQEPTGGSA